MEPIVIETANLSKRYGKQIVAVDSLNLTIRKGEIYGFLGPNGAGKTTTLRMLLGLVRPTSGTGKVLGKPLGTAEGLARVGALIESPTFYPYLSGMRNLRVLARYADVPASRVDAVLDQVELTGRAGDRFETYSQGMKQRLGVAAALLKDPELLILDEPTNGLDPQGTTEMRGLMRALGHGGHGEWVSSGRPGGQRDRESESESGARPVQLPGAGAQQRAVGAVRRSSHAGRHGGAERNARVSQLPRWSMHAGATRALPRRRAGPGRRYHDRRGGASQRRGGYRQRRHEQLWRRHEPREQQRRVHSHRRSRTEHRRCECLAEDVAAGLGAAQVQSQGTRWHDHQVQAHTARHGEADLLPTEDRT